MRLDLIVRQLLLVALVSAGSLLSVQPALAQLSNTTSTFSGDIAATCAFDGLSEVNQINYNANNNNFLSDLDYFSLSTNVPNVRLGLSRVTTNSEPQAANGVTILADAAVFQVQGGSLTLAATGSKTTNNTSPLMSASSTFALRSSIATTNPINGVFQLLPGSYSYSITLWCLL